MFNPLVFADQGLLGRLDELIATAGQVLATHKPNPPNMLTFPTLDEQAFTEWQTQCLTFLTHLYGDDYVYVGRFAALSKDPTGDPYEPAGESWLSCERTSRPGHGPISASTA